MVSCLSDKSDKEKYMFPADICQEGWQDILAGFYGAIYSTITSPALLRVTKVALKVAISMAFREKSTNWYKGPLCPDGFIYLFIYFDVA